MGKNKRKILEDPAMNNATKEGGDSHSEEAVITASKHKKHKKSKKEDQESPSKKFEHADDPSKEERDPQPEETSVTPSTHKKHKKSKKEKEANPSNQSEHTDEQETDKKKKKKKRKADEDEANEDIKPPKLKMTKATNGTDFPESERSTASKVVSTGGSSFEAVETVSGENRVKKKKNKDRKTGKEVDPLTPSEQSAVSGSQFEGPFTETSRNGDDDSQPDRVENKDKKKKKKHNKDKSETKAEEDQNGSSDGCQENGTDLSERTSKKKEKTDKLKARESVGKTDAEPNDTAEEEKQKKKDKKKKKKKEKTEESVIPIQSTSNGENHSEIMTEEKTSKKKKRAVSLSESTVSKTEAAVPDLQDCTDETKQKKKKKKKSKDKEQDAAAEDTDHGEETETDNRKQEQDAAISLGETQTNSEPTNGNASQPAAVGQWGSNMFNDNTRQNKFLRLLGGFKKAGDGSQVAPGHKKGLFGSLQPQDSSTGGQRALTYQAAQAMDRRLESDYERALSFSKRGQRGVGLGFQPDPAEGKKFHIDANRVASKKFDVELD